MWQQAGRQALMVSEPIVRAITRTFLSYAAAATLLLMILQLGLL